MKTNKIFAAFLTIAFAIVIGIGSVREASAQRYLSEFKDRSEAKALAQFANDLAEFLKLAAQLDGKGIVSPRDLAELERLGKKIKDGTSNFRSNLKTLIAKFKSDNRWDKDLDSEINETLGNRRAKGLFQRIGGRKILSDADAVLGTINVDVDAIISDAKKQQGAIKSDNPFFMKASFAPVLTARKVRFKCLALGAAIFGAELAKAPKTAENLDNMFDAAGCGAGNAATE